MYKKKMEVDDSTKKILQDLESKVGFCFRTYERKPNYAVCVQKGVPFFMLVNKVLVPTANCCSSPNNLIPMQRESSYRYKCPNHNVYVTSSACLSLVGKDMTETSYQVELMGPINKPIAVEVPNIDSFALVCNKCQGSQLNICMNQSKAWFGQFYYTCKCDASEKYKLLESINLSNRDKNIVDIAKQFVRNYPLFSEVKNTIKTLDSESNL